MAPINLFKLVTVTFNIFILCRTQVLGQIDQNFIVNGKLNISTLLEMAQDLTVEEERNFENKYITLLEVFVEFAQIMQDMYQQVETILALDDLKSPEIATFMESCTSMKNSVEKVMNTFHSSNTFQDFLLDVSKNLSENFEKLRSSGDEITKKIIDSGEKWLTEFTKLQENSIKATEIFQDLWERIEEAGFEVSDNFDPTLRLDETTAKVKGSIALKMSTLMLHYLKTLQQSADKLEAFGYFDSTNENKFEMNDIQVENLEIEVEFMEETLRKMIQLFVDAKDVLGPQSLLSFATESLLIMNIKMPQLAEKVNKRGFETKRQLNLVKQCYDGIDLKSFSTAASDLFYKVKEQEIVRDDL